MTLVSRGLHKENVDKMSRIKSTSSSDASEAAERMVFLV